MSIIDKKILNSILFFTNKDNKIDNTKILLLLWLCDRIHLNKYGRTILKDTYSITWWGPQLNNVKKLLNNVVFENFDSIYFSKTDLEVMEFVWTTYNSYEVQDLIIFSHKFPEWIRFEKQLLNSNNIKMTITDMFLKPNNSINYNFNKHETKLSKEIYLEHEKIQSILTA